LAKKRREEILITFLTAATRWLVAFQSPFPQTKFPIELGIFFDLNDGDAFNGFDTVIYLAGYHFWGP
jgi:hypothetical protein